MKRRFQFSAVIFLVVAALVLPLGIKAQTSQSERSVLKQTISGTVITVEYSRPSVRGRSPLFGGLEKWGHTWTPGANLATSIQFSKDVKLNDGVVAAGKYSVWFHLVENGPWELMLHSDTTLFHLPAPDLSEAYLLVPIQAENKPTFTETLTFNLEHVRADGGILEFVWGNTRVPINLKVDPGFEYRFEKKDIEKYLGTWAIDKSFSRPADSTIAAWKAQNPEDAASYDKYIASFDVLEERTYTYNPASQVIIIERQYDEEMLAYFEENDIDPNYYQELLIKRSEGIFSTGFMMNGEVSGAGFWSFIEFEFDDNGNATIWVERDAKTDAIQSRATRVK